MSDVWEFSGQLQHEFSDIEGPYEDDYCRMKSSNDLKVDKIVDLSSLGVVHLDTSIVSDVFCLRAFDAQKPVARLLLEISVIGSVC